MRKYKKYLVILPLAVVLLSGCTPKDVISEKDMVSIYAECYYTDALLEARPDLDAQTDHQYIYLPIIEKYGYTLEQYRNSVDYYMRNADKLVEITTEVKARLQQQMEQMEEERDAEETKVVEGVEEKEDRIEEEVLDDQAQEKPAPKKEKKQRQKLTKKQLKELENSLNQ